MPPASVDYAPKALPALRQVYGNDRLGDCVIAGMAHLVGIFTGNSTGSPVIFHDQEIISLYEAIGGYRPNDPSTDQGCNEQTALSYWMSRYAAHPIAGWLAVDPLNMTEVKTAAWLFENLVFGIELPDQWVHDADADGFVWDAGVPNPNNGHCVVSTGFDSHGIHVSSWGMIGTLTWSALHRDVIAASGGELYTVLSPEVIVRASQKAPTGFDWRSLLSDFEAFGGKVTPPRPAPPRPPQGPSRDVVIQAITIAINDLTWG